MWYKKHFLEKSVAKTNKNEKIFLDQSAVFLFLAQPFLKVVFYSTLSTSNHRCLLQLYE